ncbi:hypothetical protein [Streptomyces sp. RKAG337]|uniref:hypothetical protein n=1 Tax=Streptomyces sp. RKAG337 TaxID=2893404 RepID=UPI002033FB84|nr:hypothetical protein [Streptomyces sp. RKAG337]MCM2428560.1 hypothetical protein [Streptomyces sp. RKAG337]
MSDNAQNRLESVSTWSDVKRALIDLKKHCDISYSQLEKESTVLCPTYPVYSSTLQRRLTGGGELDWLHIQSMVMTCHAHDGARPPEWSTVGGWRACYERVEGAEPVVMEAPRGKKPKKKGRKRTGRDTRIKTGDGDGGVVVNLVHGKGNRTHGSVTKNRVKLLTSAAGAITLVGLVGGGGAMLFLGDGTEAAHPGPGGVSQSKAAPGSALPSPGVPVFPSVPTSLKTPMDVSGEPGTHVPNDDHRSTTAAGGGSGSASPTPRPSRGSSVPSNPVISVSEPPKASVAPSFKVTGGECDASDAAAGTSHSLSNESSGFTNGGTTYNEIVATSDHSKPIATGYTHEGEVSNGSSAWSWLCEAGDPSGTYDVRVKDVKSGRWSNWSRLVINP